MYILEKNHSNVNIVQHVLPAKELMPCMKKAILDIVEILQKYKIYLVIVIWSQVFVEGFVNFRDLLKL